MSLRYLKDLNLASNNLRDPSIGELSKQELKWLEILKISHNDIGNRGVKYICRADWPKLGYLSMQHTNVSSVCFKYLSKLQGNNRRIFIDTTMESVPSHLLRDLPSLGIWTAKIEGGREITAEQHESVEDEMRRMLLTSANKMAKSVYFHDRMLVFLLSKALGKF